MNKLFGTTLKSRLTNKNILYVHYGDELIRGSEIVLLDLLATAMKQGYVPFLWCNSSQLASEAEKIGVTVMCEPFVCLGYWFSPRWQFKRFCRQVISATKLINRFNIGIVHCNNGAPCQWLSLACKWLKIPLLLHLHARYQQFDRLVLLFAGADKVVGVSQSVIDVFNPNEFHASQLSTIYNGIDKSRAISHRPVDLRQLVNAHEQDRVLLYVGSLISRKSLSTVFCAIAQLPNPSLVKLAIVGDGIEKPSLIALCQRLGLEKSIYFLGEQDNVAAFYSSNADCFVSTPTEEVFGLTLAEASLAKLPVITTDIAGVNEIYTNGIHARLVSANDVVGLLFAIKELLRVPLRFQQFANAAQQHIASEFTCQKQFEQFDHVYQELQLNKSKSSLYQFVAKQCSVGLTAIYAKLSNKWQKRVMLTGKLGQSHE